MANTSALAVRLSRNALRALAAVALAARLPPLPLVPVPRSLSRRWRYGIDPSRLLARRLSRHLGVPVWDLLVPPLHGPRRAGGDHDRPAPGFRLRSPPRGPVIVVDDVVTTGATLMSAVAALGSRKVALVASVTAVAQVSSLPSRYGIP
ncbi:MAG TPA: hypothetical protein EYP11_06135 [Aquificaceae bacterium]|nr:hypothetical protein [Aquificaceae bacterium]